MPRAPRPPPPNHSRAGSPHAAPAARAASSPPAAAAAPAGGTAPFLPAALSRIRCATWNTLALNATDLLRAKDRHDRIQRLALHYDIIALQECHGTTDAIAASLEDQRLTHDVWTSGCDKAIEGGVALLVRRSVVSDASHISMSHIVTGRILRLRIGFDDEQFIILYSVHNFGLSTTQLHDLRKLFARDAADVADAGSGRAILIAAGDWNFTDAATGVTTADSAGATHYDPPLATQRGSQCVLPLIEVAFPDHTRFERRTMGLAPTRLRSSQLDRFYIAVAGALLPQLTLSAAALDRPTPEAPERSDHLPVGASIAIRAPAPRHARSRHRSPDAQSSAPALLRFSSLSLTRPSLRRPAPPSEAGDAHRRPSHAQGRPTAPC